MFPHAKYLVAVLLQGYQSCPQEDRFLFSSPHTRHIGTCRKNACPDSLCWGFGFDYTSRMVSYMISGFWEPSWILRTFLDSVFCSAIHLLLPDFLIVYRPVFLLILVILTRPCVYFKLMWSVRSFLVLYLLVLNLVFQDASWVGRENFCISGETPTPYFPSLTSYVFYYHTPTPYMVSSRYSNRLPVMP